MDAGGHFCPCGKILVAQYILAAPQTAIMQAKLDEFPLFERVSDEELEGDIAASLLTEATEEGQKVARNSGKVRGCG